MNLGERESGKLTMDLVRIPAVPQMAAYDFCDLCGGSLNECHTGFIQFNKRPGSRGHWTSLQFIFRKTVFETTVLQVYLPGDPRNSGKFRFTRFAAYNQTLPFPEHPWLRIRSALFWTPQTGGVFS
jgi:hypothetical protein